jgi:hypothetical protein
MPRSGMVELYTHSPLRLYGAALNYLRTGTPLLLLINVHVVTEWPNDAVETLNKNTEKENVYGNRQINFINYIKRKTMPGKKSTNYLVAKHRTLRKKCISLLSSFRCKRQQVLRNPGAIASQISATFRKVGTTPNFAE